MRLHLFVGIENYVFSRLRPRRQTTSPLLPSTIHHSIPQSIEMQWFLVDVLSDDGSPPTLRHSNSVLCHSLLRSAKPSARREEAPARLTQLLPFLSSPSQLNLFPTPSLLLLQRLLLFPLLPLPYPYAVTYPPPPRSCITAAVLVSGFLYRQTQRMALWHYICFGGYQEHNTNEHGRGGTVHSLYGDQGPLNPGNFMSKFTRCSHPFLLIYISSFASQRNRRHPQPIIPHPKNVLATPCDIPHLTLSLSHPILVHSSIHLHRRPSSAKFEVQDRTRFPSPTETPLARVHFPSPCYIWQLYVRSCGGFDCQQVYIPVLVPCSTRGTNRCKPAIGSLMDLSEYSSLALLPHHPWVG